MSANLSTRTFRPYTGEKARIARAYDYLVLVLALFLFIGSFHLHFALTVGDWDFWVDWKDRQWWPAGHAPYRHYLSSGSASRVVD